MRMNLCKEHQKKDAVYRFMPVHRLLEIFSKKDMKQTLALMAPARYKEDDPFEGWLFEKLIEEHSTCPKWTQYRRFKEHVFFLCLSVDKETDQIWKTYTPHALGVRIKIKIDKLKKRFGDEYVLGCVKYRIKGRIQKEVINKYMRIEEPSEEQLLDLYFWKMKGFMTDNEIRLATVERNAKSDIKLVDFDYHHLLEHIMFDPRMKKDVFESYKDYVSKRFGIEEKRISRSTLYQPEERFKFHA